MENVTQGMKAMAIIREIGLDTHLIELNNARQIPVEKRKELQAKRQALSALQKGELLAAQDVLKGQDANLHMIMKEEKDAAGKARWTNDKDREARIVQLQQGEEGESYRKALDRVREIERQVEDIRLAIQALEEDIKSASEVTWTLRTLVEGETTALKAMAVFDGPRLPSEILHVFPANSLTTEKGAA